MRVFVSSAIFGLEPFRQAAKDALVAFASDRSVDLSVFMSEAHHAVEGPPLQVCRDQVAQADLLVGIYGGPYGFVDEQTGKSVTHLEMEWALDTFHRPLLAFLLDEDVEDGRQRELRDRVGDFRLGVWFAKVRTPEELRFELYRALESRLPEVSRQSRLLAQEQRIRDDDLDHLAMPLHSADTLRASQLPTVPDDPRLAESVKASLEAGTDAVFVLGEVGSGKTWFLKQLFCDALDAYRNGQSDRVPCLLDLGDTVLEPHRASWPWDWPGLIGPAGGERTLLLLDAYDEAVAKSPPGSRLELLESVLSVASGRCQLVVSSRSHLFETSERLSRLIETAGYSSTRSSNRERRFSHRTIFVKALGEDDVRVFLRDEFEDGDALWRRMKSVIDLPDLAKRPVLLPMVCESLGELEEAAPGERITAGHLYRTYTERWLSREGWRLGLGTETARRFFEELALHFHNGASDGLLFDEFPEVFPSFFPAARLSAERERLVDALRSASLLSNDAAGKYGFAHRSFLEYFLAERLIYAIVRGETDFALERFPSKVTDAFAIDLLARETDWVSGLLSLIEHATSPVVRYLCAYLANRVTRERGIVDREQVEPVLRRALETEESPFVVRELLVSLADLGYPLDEDALVRHLENPVPPAVIELELKDYYGSLEEARLYLRSRLQPPSEARLRLFYLISLAAIATQSDIPLLGHYSAAGDRHESRIAQLAIQALAEPEPTC